MPTHIKITGAQRSFAVDLPSGADADRAIWLNAPLRFDHVLALGAWKYAHLLEPVASDCGTLSLIKIGVDTHDHTVARLGCCALRQVAGGKPVARLKARANAASDS